MKIIDYCAIFFCLFKWSFRGYCAISEAKDARGRQQGYNMAHLFYNALKEDYPQHEAFINRLWYGCFESVLSKTMTTE